MPENGSVELTIRKQIGIVEFHHPRGNSLPGLLLEKLVSTIRKAAGDPGIRVLILQSRGNGAFCAGASIDELAGLADYEEGKAFFMRFAALLGAMRSCPKFILSRVHGRTVGGGVGIVAASDYAVAHESASVRLSEISLGIGPFVISPAIIHKTGRSAFSTIALDPGTWYDARWAERHGLYNRVAETTSDLDRTVHKLAETLASASPDASEELKRILWQQAGDWSSDLEKKAEISARLAVSDPARQLLNRLRTD